LSTFQLMLFVLLPGYVIALALNLFVARLWSKAKSRRTGVREPVKVGPIGSIVFLPLFFVFALLSIPYTWIWRKVQARQEADFARQMKKAARTISWEKARTRTADGAGTLLCESQSFKGPSRLWWTADCVAELSPFPFVRSDDKEHIWFEPKFRAFGKWCFETYTNPASGRALLVERAAADSKAFWEEVKNVDHIMTCGPSKKTPGGQVAQT